MYSIMTLGAQFQYKTITWRLSNWKEKSTTFLPAHDRTLVVGRTPNAKDGTEVEAKTSIQHNAVLDIGFIHPSSTDDVRLSLIEYNELEKFLNTANCLNFPLASSGILWQAECSRLKQVLKKALMSGEWKSFSLSEPSTPSISISQNKTERGNQFELEKPVLFQ